jgi:PTS system cellobiose-specific IIB component
MSTKISLFCTAGMSTTLLVKKMKDEATAKHIDVTIDAHPVSEIKGHAKDADVILLGPQIAYKQDEVQNEYPDHKIAVIGMRDYGMMNGPAVLQQALDLAQT